MVNAKRDEMAKREAARVKSNSMFLDIGTVAEDSFKRGFDAAMMLEIEANLKAAKNFKPEGKKG